MACRLSRSCRKFQYSPSPQKNPSPEFRHDSDSLSVTKAARLCRSRPPPPSPFGLKNVKQGEKLNGMPPADCRWLDAEHKPQAGSVPRHTNIWKASSQTWASSSLPPSSAATRASCITAKRLSNSAE